jgi:hypothetical protein
MEQRTRLEANFVPSTYPIRNMYFMIYKTDLILHFVQEDRMKWMLEEASLAKSPHSGNRYDELKHSGAVNKSLLPQTRHRRRNLLQVQTIHPEQKRGVNMSPYNA